MQKEKSKSGTITKKINKKCKTCLYRLDVPGLKVKICCGYLYFTGHMRGCDAEECEKYIRSAVKEESERRKIIKQQ